MTLDDIVALAREWLDDETEPFLYSKERLYQYADEAQNQVCLRTRCLIDSTTASICTIPIVAGQASYKLHAAIVVARRVEYVPTTASCNTGPLTRTTFDMLDRFDPQWRQRTGRPDSVVFDMRQRQLTLNSIPGTDDLGNLYLTVWRKPTEAEQLGDGGDEPVEAIDEQSHMHMAHWICYRAFTKKDGEANDSKRAGEHYAQFENVFGPAPTFQELLSLSTEVTGEVVGYF